MWQNIERTKASQALKLAKKLPNYELESHAYQIEFSALTDNFEGKNPFKPMEGAVRAVWASIIMYHKHDPYGSLPLPQLSPFSFFDVTT